MAQNLECESCIDSQTKILHEGNRRFYPTQTSAILRVSFSMIPPAYLVGTAAVTENLLKRRWSAIILRHLANEISDPAEICKLEPAISPAAMNERLRNMLRFCLITRYPRASPSKVIEYKLTSRGHKILKVLNFIDQLDNEASQQNHQDEERTLVTVRRKKTTPSIKKGLTLDDSNKPANQPTPRVKYA